uniref:Tudor domain-containing protein n=1 Tax=Leptocylindrus danicus TaxID=163516 RepID=A0A7S2LLK1_9STRA|mmetsp:Transcript_6464/g.9529  ORF Transcript_6464/g.9529 Transcript_6464/m.9529 type:complete len:1036 (+) Transcript_6464:853-3960(+)
MDDDYDYMYDFEPSMRNSTSSTGRQQEPTRRYFGAEQYSDSSDSQDEEEGKEDDHTALREEMPVDIINNTSRNISSKENDNKEHAILRQEDLGQYSGKIAESHLNERGFDDGESELGTLRGRRHATTPTVHFAEETFRRSSPKKNEVTTAIFNKESMSPFDRGDVVEAKFRGRGSRWYKGKISNLKANGTFDVDYDDGDHDSGLHADSIRLIVKAQRKRPTQEHETSKRNVKLAIGTKVEARYRGKSMFYPGKISRARLNGTFDVDYDDGSKEMGIHREMIKIIDADDLDGSDCDSVSISVSSRSNVTPPDRAPAAFRQGDRVEAKFRGKGSKWYKGKIVRVHNDGAYDIDYDDGDRDIHLSSDSVRAVEQTKQENSMKPNEVPTLKVGTDVEARLKGKSKFYPGKISRVRLNGTYDISYENGQRELGVKSDLIKIVKMERNFDSTKDSKSLKQGAIVEARYRGGGRFYKGMIVSVNSNGTFDIAYDDGQKELNVQQSLIRCLQYTNEETCTQQIENTEELKKETEKAEQSLKEGDRVEAKFRGKGRKWYKGVISRVRLNNTFDVDYDDGDHDSALSANFIRKNNGLSQNKEEHSSHQEVVEEPSATEKLVVGSRVKAQYRGRSKYYPGKVSRARLNGTFDIAYDDGEQELGVARSLIQAIANNSTAEESMKEKYNGKEGARYDNTKHSPMESQEKSKEKIVTFETFKVGDRIEAKFLGKSDFCPGKIIRARLNGTFDIEYDNGEKELSVTRDFIKVPEKSALNCDGNNGVASRPSPGSETNSIRSNNRIHSFSEGDVVEARFRGRGSRWYRGRISRVSSDGKNYDVDYDDGDRDTGLSRNSIRLAQTNEKIKTESPSKAQSQGNINARLEVGTRVEAKYRGKSKYYPGTISRVRLNGRFDIDYDDGEKEVNVPRDFIRTETQIVKPLPSKSMQKEDKPNKNSPCPVVSNEIAPVHQTNFSGNRGNRWHRGVISKVKVVYLYEVEYEDGQKDVNLPVEALRNTNNDSKTRMAGDSIKVGESVEVLSWQDRFAGFS